MKIHAIDTSDAVVAGPVTGGATMIDDIPFVVSEAEARVVTGGSADSVVSRDDLSRGRDPRSDGREGCHVRDAVRVVTPAVCAEISISVMTVE